MGGFPFRLEHSDGLEVRACEIGEIIANGLNVLSGILGFAPSLRVLVLSRSDWGEFTDQPIYGMPHSIDGQTLVVAPEPPDFWDGIRGWALGPVSESGLERLQEVYGLRNDEIDVRPYTDLMVLHELGHIYHRQVPFEFPRKWASEIFANLCQYTSVARGMPERLPHLVTLPGALHRGPEAVTYTALNDFDEHGAGVGVGNYVWYQWQFLFAAKSIYDSEGPCALRNLFDAALQTCDRTLSDEELVSRLERKVSPMAASIYRRWPLLR